MTAYIESAEGNRFGVEPICRTLDWNPSTFYAARSRQPSRRALTDASLIPHILRVHKDNYGVYGVRKVHKQLRREGFEVARCSVARLMRAEGLQGARRGRKKRTTIADHKAARPADLVERNFKARRPNALWVADITFVATWSAEVHVAFVVDCYSRLIVGWALATHLRTDLPLDALEMAMWRRNTLLDGLIHHSDAGSQYTSIRYTERLGEAGIEPSVGSVGDSYDNALAESTIGLYKTELIEARRPWRTPDQVELATLEWIDWFNHRRLHSSIGDVPPAELEDNYYDVLNATGMQATETL